MPLRCAACATMDEVVPESKDNVGTPGDLGDNGWRLGRLLNADHLGPFTHLQYARLLILRGVHQNRIIDRYTPDMDGL